MKVKGVGSFYASHGDYVEIAPEKGVTNNSVELYLNGSVYGAILHQRKMLPLHGSSFETVGRGVMLCGESGAGKSSLTTSFCLKGAGFLTDDVTPVFLRDGLPHILPKSARIKLWNDSLKQLTNNDHDLDRIRPDQEKFYFSIKKKKYDSHPLHDVLMLAIGDVQEVDIQKITGTEAFSAIYNEIYRVQYLSAMPENETDYLKKIAAISSYCNVYRVTRPKFISIDKMRRILQKFLEQNQ
ncbi:MAG: hypothetical protein JJU13_17410 [Balneolaceae bacterium]|nr:hypothetical protein [Balneolaceae bacterium]